MNLPVCGTSYIHSVDYPNMSCARPHLSNDEMNKINKVSIFGVGLIGGSLGLAIKKNRLAAQVVGIGRRLASLRNATRRGAIDRGTLNIKEGVKDADLVIMAMPVRAIPKCIRAAGHYLKPGALISDVGSVKSRIVREAERLLPANVDFVGAHPMAGSEKKGVDFSNASLFKGTVCILTKTHLTNEAALRRMKKFWGRLGARCVVLTPRQHDRIAAAVSHLPHIIAVALVSSIDPNILWAASSGFSDGTRVASGEPEIWRGIFIDNKEEILKGLSLFETKLKSLKRSIAAGEVNRLNKVLKRAKDLRDTLRYKKR